MEEKKHILFIVNPISGTKSKDHILKWIDELLDQEKFTYEVKKTEYAGHAATLTKEAADNGTPIIVAVGGDGTVNEVARSLVHTSSALGIIPCGSGNGLARHLQIPMNAKKAIALLNECNISSLDYGMMNNLPFFCTCGMGFDAFISEKFASSGKRGPITYVENTLKQWLHYKPDTYTIVADDNEACTYKAFLIACANASQYGNNAYIAPQASMSDGLLDITIMEPFKTLEAPRLAIQLFGKTIKKNSHIKTLRAKKLHITRQNGGAVHCDGDAILAGNEIDVKLIDKGFLAVTNANARLNAQSILQIFGEYLENISYLRRNLVEHPTRFLTINRILLKKLRKW